MKYVVDSCIGFKTLVPEALTDKAELLLQDYKNAVHELLSPDVYAAEVIHALTRAERQGRITPAQGGKLYASLMTSLPKLHPYMSLLPRAYDISSKMRIGVYDCLYVTLAERAQCELATADDKLVKNLQPQFPFIRHLSTFP